MPETSPEAKIALGITALSITAEAVLAGCSTDVLAQNAAEEAQAKSDASLSQQQETPFNEKSLMEQADSFMQKMEGVQVLRDRFDIKISPDQLGTIGDDGISYPSALKDGGILGVVKYGNREYNIVVSYSSPYFNSAQLGFLKQSGLEPKEIGDHLGRAFFMTATDDLEVSVYSGPYGSGAPANLTLAAGTQWVLVPQMVRETSSRTIPKWQVDENGDLYLSNGQPVSTSYPSIQVQMNNYTGTDTGGVGFLLLQVGKLDEQSAQLHLQAVGTIVSPTTIYELIGQENAPYTDLETKPASVDTSTNSNQQ